MTYSLKNKNKALLSSVNSLRATLNQVSPNILHYDKSDNMASTSVKVKLGKVILFQIVMKTIAISFNTRIYCTIDAEKKYETQNDTPINGPSTYVVASALKASNDSGCKDFELKEDMRITPCTLNINKSFECLDQVSDGDEDDEDLLTACINIGMQNNR